MTADGAPAAPGEPGEIQYRSPQLLSGYWNRPDATADAFTDWDGVSGERRWVGLENFERALHDDAAAVCPRQHL